MANRRGQYVGRVFSLGLLILSCGDESTKNSKQTIDTEVEAGKVGVRENTVIAPGATLLYHGETGDGRLDASGNALVGIARGDKYYLYHPAVGDAPLNEETSRLSVGYFLAGVEPDKSSSALTVKPDGKAVLSDTGVRLSMRVAGAPLSADNEARRFAAISTDKQTKPYFLAPASSPVPTNLVDALLSDIDAEGWSTSTVSDIDVEKKAQIHGAVMRAAPLLIAGDNLESARRSKEADPVLFADLAYLDFAHLAVTGMESLLGLIPTECADALTESTVKAVAKKIATSLLEDEYNADAFRVLYTDELKNTMNAWATCGIQAAATASNPLAGLAIELYLTFLDIAALGNWLVNDALIGTYQAAFGMTAFDEVTVDASAPTVVGTYPLDSPAFDVEALLSDVYVMTSDALHIIDVNPDGTAAPIAEVPLSNGRGLAVNGSDIFVAAGGLALYSAVDPTAPVLESRIGYNTTSMAVAVGGGYIFVAAGAYTYDTDTGLFTVNRVLDPTDMDNGIEWTGGLELPGGAIHDLAVTDDNQYVVLYDDEGDLHIVDVRIPAGPKVVGRLDGEAVRGSRRGLVLNGDTVYLANESFRIVDISDKTAPRLLFDSGPDGFRNVDFEDGRLYVTGGFDTGWLGAFDVSDPENPELLSATELDHIGNAVDVYSGYAFIACSDGTAGALIIVSLDGDV